MGKTSIDARRHVRIIEELFEQGSEITREVFEELVQEYKKRKYLRQSMKRLITRGFIKNHGKKLLLTEAGRIFFKKETIREKKKIPCDGRWRIISFDVPGDYSRDRNRLRALLKGFDFYQLQKSVWVCPNSVADDFWKLVVGANLHRFCKAMVVEIIEGDQLIKKHFQLKIS